MILAARALAGEPEPRFQIFFFTADWCGPCRAVYPVLRKHDNDAKCLRVISVDVDRQREVASQFQVDTIPVVIGKEVQGAGLFRIDGAGEQELRSLDAALAGFVRQCREKK